jgi:hypothetical protein
MRQLGANAFNRNGPKLTHGAGPLLPPAPLNVRLELDHVPVRHYVFLTLGP